MLDLKDMHCYFRLAQLRGFCAFYNFDDACHKKNMNKMRSKTFKDIR